ncbi:WD repeat-containing protein 76 [Nephila pilipes]|uniref:WD repeat-containing protein 76 n=1 Tax=Nephila pilipes TaxID=299642 RepID=A0A8X6PAC7_NEPPI|nr:WD repeat-containing protein 76 [Nephila pilipes]
MIWEDSSDEYESEIMRESSSDEDEIQLDELSECEEMMHPNKEEKIVFSKSLKRTEVKEKFKDAAGSLKPPKSKKNVKSSEADQISSLMSLQWEKTNETASEAREIAKAEKELIKALAIKDMKRKRKQQNLSDEDELSCFQTRKSLRLEKKDIDLSEAAIEAKAIAKSAKELIEVTAEEKLVKGLPPILSFEKAITGENTYDDFVHDFDDVDFKISEPFYDYVSHFKNMKIDETKIAKVVNNRITTMDIHPVKEKIIVCVGNNYGDVGIWDVNSNSFPYEFRPHLLGITNIKCNPDLPNVFYTSSNDGIVRCGDIENKNFTEIYNISAESCCTYFDFLSSTNLLVSQQDGHVCVVDNRSDCNTGEMRHKCHKYSVKSVSVHPVNKSYFVSAGMKGLITLWDLRKLQEKPVIAVRHHKKVVSSAFFSPVTGNTVLTTSSDDSISLFATSKLGDVMAHQRSLRHNNFTGQWLTPFKATWLPNSDDIFVIGSMLNPRRIEIFNNEMKNIFNFQDELLCSIVSVNAFHPSLPVLAGCNCSGKVHVFSE